MARILKNKYDDINSALVDFAYQNNFTSNIFIEISKYEDYSHKKQKDIYQIAKNKYLKKGKKVVYNNGQKIICYK